MRIYQPPCSATEYIAGTTQNPLVVGLNDTTNSDKRIFGSDGNATMASCVVSFHLHRCVVVNDTHRFAKSPELFASTCADLFARMIDTVPRGVQLSEVLTPLPVKPDNLELVLDGDALKFSAEVRVSMSLRPNYLIIIFCT